MHIPHDPQRRAARAKKSPCGCASLTPHASCVRSGRARSVKPLVVRTLCAFNPDYLLLVAELATAIPDFDIKISPWPAHDISTLHPGLHLWQVLELRPQLRPMEPVDHHPTPAKRMNSFQSSVGKSNDYKEYRKRVLLYERKMDLAGRKTETAFNVMSSLKNRAWDACEDLTMEVLESERGMKEDSHAVGRCVQVRRHH